MVSRLSFICHSFLSPSYTTVLHGVVYGLVPLSMASVWSCSVIVMGLSTLLKMLMIDPPSPAGNPGMSLIKLFLEFQDFLESSAPDLSSCLFLIRLLFNFSFVYTWWKLSNLPNSSLLKKVFNLPSCLFLIKAFDLPSCLSMMKAFYLFHCLFQAFGLPNSLFLIKALDLPRVVCFW